MYSSFMLGVLRRSLMSLARRRGSSLTTLSAQSTQYQPSPNL